MAHRSKVMDAKQMKLPLTPDAVGATDERHYEHVALTNLIRSIFGDDSWDDSSAETARRVLEFWRSMSPKTGRDFKITTFPAIVQQMILVKDIEFVSLCAHHLLPFFGVAHVAYVPHVLMIGLSKIPRLVDFWAHRPCTQESLTHLIADELKHTLEAKGVAVVMEARHTCMACRGVMKTKSVMVTSEMRGIFLTDPSPRQEFFNLVERRGLD